MKRPTLATYQAAYNAIVNKIRRLVLVLRHSLSLWRTLNLPKNRCKGDWRNEDLRDLLELLRKEVAELEHSCWEYECGGGSSDRVVAESADVSAFAAMVADKARTK